VTGVGSGGLAGRSGGAVVQAASAPSKTDASKLERRTDIEEDKYVAIIIGGGRCTVFTDIYCLVDDVFRQEAYPTA
jgi:hypothetical protein